MEGFCSVRSHPSHKVRVSGVHHGSCEAHALPIPAASCLTFLRLMRFLCIVDVLVHRRVPFNGTAGLPIYQSTLPCAMMLMVMMLHKMAY